MVLMVIGAVFRPTTRGRERLEQCATNIYVRRKLLMVLSVPPPFHHVNRHISNITILQCFFYFKNKSFDTSINEYLSNLFFAILQVYILHTFRLDLLF